MGGSNKNSWIKHLDFILIDVMCMELSLGIAYILRNSLGTGVVLGKLYPMMAGILLLVNLVVALFNESYQGILRRGYLKEFKAAFVHTSLVVLISLLTLYLTKSMDHYSRIVFVTMWALYLFFTYVTRCAWKKQLIHRGKQNEGKTQLLIICRESQAKSIVRTIQANNFGQLKLQGIVMLDEPYEEKEIEGLPVVTDVEHVLEYIRTNWVDGVFLDYVSGNVDITKIICGCWEMGVTLHLKLVDKLVLNGNQSVERIGGYTVLTSTIISATIRQLFCKRVMDIVGATVGLIMTGVVTLIIGPAIMIKSPGPIFFSQQRVGKNGKTFRIYKFRSMYLDAEERKAELISHNAYKDGMMFKIENDPRIIKGIGHFIRNTSLDELPQFWNVLKGEMSLVGTRPPTLDEWRKYELHHRKRMAIKPGITGMWQVSGRSNVNDFEEVVKLDTKYIEKWSLGLDIKILLKTIWTVLKRDGAI